MAKKVKEEKIENEKEKEKETIPLEEKKEVVKEDKEKDTKKKDKKNKDSKNKKKDKADKKDKKTKKKHVFGPFEFSFNFISIVFVICVALYYGGRSFYYYSLQSQAKKETGMTLNVQVLEHNKLVKDSTDGMHKDDNGYFFKGDVKNNYVWFANRMFRVMRVNDDGTVKLVTDDLVSSFMWGEAPAYDNSNVRNWLTKTDDEISGIYYNTIPNQGRFIQKTKYTIDVLSDTKVISGDVEFDDYIVPVSLNDYVTAGGKSSYLNNGRLYFILGYNEDDENLYIEEDGSIMNCAYYDGYGIRGVFTMSKNIPVSQGDGTKNNPYVIDQGQDINYVDGYVKLGKDTWKVYEEKDGKLKMYLNDYIKENDKEVVRNFSNGSTRIDFFNPNNIGGYLFSNYFNSLSYKDYLVDNDYPFGMMNDEYGHLLKNVYSTNYTARIAMLNIFSYVSNNDLSDFFRDNVGNDTSTTQYSVLSSGLLEEADVTDVKHIVPVVSISASSIKSGSGRKDNPYVLE